MEKKIGEKFEFRGVMLEVVESSNSACGCCFAKEEHGGIRVCSALSDCSMYDRKDGKNVIFKRFVPAKTFFDAYTDLIVEAERVAKLAETPEQHAVCNETVDRLIAMRASLSPVTARTAL